MSARCWMVLSAALALGTGATQAVAQPAEPAVRPAAPEAPDDDAAFSLTGRITDEDGNPVTDAQLLFRPQQRGVRVPAVRTNANGEFQVNAVDAPVTCGVVIVSTGWVLADSTSLESVDLKPGVAAKLDIKMQRACQVMVRVADEQGRPVQGARLRMTPLGERERSRVVPPPGRLSTNAEGLALVGGMLPNGDGYQIEFTHENFASSHLVLKPTDPNVRELQQLTLLAGQTVTGKAICSDGLPAAGWEIQVAPSWSAGPAFSAPVTIAEDGTFALPRIVPGTYDLLVRVTGPDGRPGGGYPVESGVDLLSRSPLVLNLKLLSPASQGTIKGRIEYIGEPPEQGVYLESLAGDGVSTRVAFVQPGQSDFVLGPLAKVPTRISVTGPGVETQVVIVTPPAEGVVIKVSRTVQPKLAGLVVDDATGQPVPEFRIIPIRNRMLAETNYPESTGLRTFRDAAGKFETTFNNPGIYQLVIVAAGYAPLRTPDLNSQERPAELPTFRLGRGGTLRGKVVDEAGAPVNGANVAWEIRGARQDLNSGSLEFATAVSRAGAFELSNMAAGPQLFRIAHPDFAELYVERDIAPQPAEPIEFILPAGGTVRGTLFDAAGDLVRNAAVELRGGPYLELSTRGDGNFLTAISDENGGYAFSRVPAGDYSLLRAGGFPSRGVQQQVVHVENRGMHTVPLGGTSVISGRVILDGKPLANSQVRIADQTNFQAAESTDADGRFRFLGVPPGRRHMAATLPGSRYDFVGLGSFDFVATGNDLGDLSVDTGSVAIRLESPAGPNPLHRPWINHLDSGPSRLFMGNPGAMTPPAQPGEPYFFRSMLFGRHRVSVTLGAWTQVEQDFEIPRDRPDVTVTLQLPSGTAALRGTVPAEYRPHWQRLGLGLIQPATGFRAIMRVYPDGVFEATGLPAGEYRLIDLLRPGETLLDLSFAEGETKTLALDAAVLDRPADRASRGTLSIRVFTIEGCPLPCHIELTDPAGRVEPVAASDSRLSPAVPPGKYQLKVAFPGFETQTREVEGVEYKPGEQVEPQNVYLAPRW